VNHLSIKAGDIIIVDLDPTQGGEKSKTRPCLVVVGEGHPWHLIIVVPITDHNTHRHPKLSLPIPHPDKTTGLSKQSSIDCFQLRCLSKKRFKQKIGVVTQEILDDTLSRMGTILNIGEEHVM